MATLTACRTTHQARSAEESGFLGDYSRMQEGKGDRAKMYYLNPMADWPKYTKMYIAPVQLWNSDDPESKLGKLSDDDKKMLVDYLYTALNTSLSKDYQIVSQPGPDVLVLRTAITEAKKSRPALNLVSSVMPIGIALSYTKRIIFGTGLNVGEAQIEVEITDGGSNERLAAAVDRRAGTKAIRTKFNGWFGDCRLAFDYWAEHLQTRLAQERMGISESKAEL